MSNGICNSDVRASMLDLPGETESGSAGTQPDKGYPGLRCANGASGPRWLLPSGVDFFQTLGHRSYASKNPSTKSNLSNNLRLSTQEPDEPCFSCLALDQRNPAINSTKMQENNVVFFSLAAIFIKSLDDK